MFKRVSAATISFVLSISLAAPLSCYASKKEQDGTPPAVVTIAPVKVENWQPDITATGTLSGNQGIIIKPEIEGRITGIYFHSGAIVKAGDLLMQINPDVLQANYADMAAKTRLSQANYKRAILLYNKHVFSKADLDTALSNYQADKATADQAKASLDQATLRAPFSGRLGLRMVNLGDYVAAGQAIVNLVATDPMRVDFSLPETYINQIVIGQTVILTSPSYLNQSFKGKVYAMESIIDPNTRTLGIRAVIPNPNQKLIPGAFVEVKLITGSAAKIIMAPQTALTYEGDTIYIYKVINGKAVKTKVTTGARKGNDIAISNGLKASDSIIVAGQMKVTDGQAVTAGQQ